MVKTTGAHHYNCFCEPFYFLPCVSSISYSFWPFLAPACVKFPEREGQGVGKAQGKTERKNGKLGKGMFPLVLFESIY